MYNKLVAIYGKYDDRALYPILDLIKKTEIKEIGYYNKDGIIEIQQILNKYDLKNNKIFR